MSGPAITDSPPDDVGAAAAGTFERGVWPVPAELEADVEVSPELVEEHGLSPDEFELIRAIQGRDPTLAELGVFSAMWSEHCGYKNSRPLLRTLPTEAPHVVQGPGENAGVIDIGDGWGAAFKIESHNHPSAVEPYQGAATGAGGILRDVFTMGARPIALFDSLRFGSLDSPRSRYLLDGVVRGVGDYGNCVGVPTVGGETVFDPAYEKNPLVNVMCVGLLRLDDLIRGEAKGVGNPVMAVGARTGRDGIHGATFASEELSETALDSRPQVQVGDPFTEKLLLEASLELIRRDLLIGIQDMGAAGLTSSATEMAARSGSGIDIDVRKVPLREEGMTPYEILLSESQERMLLVARPEHEADVRKVLERWDLQAATIGHVTDDGLFRVRDDGRIVAEIPVEPLVDECPTYVREGVESETAREQRETDLAPYLDLESDARAAECLLQLLDAPTIASRRWIYEQYDVSVQNNTVAGPGGDAAVLRVADTNRALAVSVDGNGRYVYLDPYTGGQLAVAEAARNVACTGARPLAVTNCLNFGSPLRTAVYYQLDGAVRGIGDACDALGTPVTGGNVSLYNETGGTPIYPTPIIGMVGVMDDYRKAVPAAFQAPGDEIWLVGVTFDDLGGSEYLAVCHGLVAGEPPLVEIDREADLIEYLVAAAGHELHRSAHDCSEGGLAVALAECALRAPGGPVGVDVDVPDALLLSDAGEDAPARSASALFGESPTRVVCTCPPGAGGPIAELAAEHGLAARRIGTVGGAGGTFRVRAAGRIIELPVGQMHEVYETALPRRMREQAGLTT